MMSKMYGSKFCRLLQTIILITIFYQALRTWVSFNNFDKGYPNYDSAIGQVTTKPHELKTHDNHKIFLTGASVVSKADGTIKGPRRLLRNTSLQINDKYFLPSDTVAWVIGGRLGNALFQYSAIVAIGKATGKKVALISQRPRFDAQKLCRFFKVPLSHILIPNADGRLLPPYPYDVTSPGGLRAETVHFIPAKVSVVGKRGIKTALISDRVKRGFNVFTGFPNSPQYFASVSGEVRNVLSFKVDILDQANTFLKDNTRATRNKDKGLSSVLYVGIHLRGTDMSVWGAGEFDMKVYMRKALQTLDSIMRGQSSSRSLFYVVCSDDVGMSREITKEFFHDPSANVIHCPGKSPFLDMAILSLCHHVIITQGTFGWWAAYLADKGSDHKIIYPMEGAVVGKGGTITYTNFSNVTYPEHWIGIIA